MAFLSAFGRVMKTVGRVGAEIAGVGPVFAIAFPKQGKHLSRITDVASVVATTVQYAEAMVDANGSEKLKKATPLVAQAMRMSELLTDKEIADEEKFLRGCEQITSGMADVLNSLKED